MDTFWSATGTIATVVFGLLVTLLLSFNIIARLARFFISRAERRITDVRDALPPISERREASERGLQAAEAVDEEIEALHEKVAPLVDLREEDTTPEAWAEREELITTMAAKVAEMKAVLEEVTASHAEHGEQLARVEVILDRAKSEGARAKFLVSLIDF